MKTLDWGKINEKYPKTFTELKVYFDICEYEN